MIQKAPLIAAILVSFALLTTVEAKATCFDAKIRARPIEQIPSEFPDCGNDCIIISWPWFIDLKVSRVIEGSVPGKIVRVLAIQHTYLVARERTWLLRKNTAGGYNYLALENDVTPVLCSANAASVEPYIRPSKGQTLDELRDVGIQRYGRHTN